MRRTVTITGITAAMVWLVLGGSTAFARRAPAIPTTFHAQSTTWVSPEHGLMLGSAPCGADACATVIGTTDGGRTWNQVGALDAPVTFERRTGVTEIRFADDLHGWAFDPALWTTDDGGATWTKLATPGARPAVALAGDADGVYLVVSACRFGVPLSNCLHREALWRTRPGS